MTSNATLSPTNPYQPRQNKTALTNQQTRLGGAFTLYTPLTYIWPVMELGSSSPHSIRADLISALEPRWVREPRVALDPLEVQRLLGRPIAETLPISTRTSADGTGLLMEDSKGAARLEESNLYTIGGVRHGISSFTAAPSFNIGSQRDVYSNMFDTSTWVRITQPRPPRDGTPRLCSRQRIGDTINSMHWDPPGPNTQSIFRSVGNERCTLDRAFFQLVGILLLYDLGPAAQRTLLEALALLCWTFGRITGDTTEVMHDCSEFAADFSLIRHVVAVTKPLAAECHIVLPGGPSCPDFLVDVLACHRSRLDEEPQVFTSGYGILGPVFSLMIESSPPHDVFLACQRLHHTGYAGPMAHQAAEGAFTLAKQYYPSLARALPVRMFPTMAPILTKLLRFHPSGEGIGSGGEACVPSAWDQYAGLFIVCQALATSPDLLDCPGGSHTTCTFLERARAISKQYEVCTAHQVLHGTDPTETPVVLSDSGTLYVSSPLLCGTILALALLPTAAYFALSVVYSTSSRLGNLSSVFLLLSGVILGTGPAYMRRGWQYYDFLRFRVPAGYSSDANRCLPLFLLKDRDATVSTVRGDNGCYLPESLLSPSGNVDADEPVHLIDLLYSHAHATLLCDRYDRFVLYCEGKYALLESGLNHMTQYRPADTLTPVYNLKVGILRSEIGRVTIGSRAARRRADREQSRGQRRLTLGPLGMTPPPPGQSTLINILGSLHGQRGPAPPAPPVQRAHQTPTNILPLGFRPQDVSRSRSMTHGYASPVGSFRGTPMSRILAPHVDGDYVAFVYSLLGTHARDHYVDRRGAVLTFARFAYLARRVIDDLGIYPLHFFKALSPRCRVVASHDGQKRLMIPVHADDTKYSLRRIKLYIAGGIAPEFQRASLPTYNGVWNLARAGEALASMGSLVIGHVFPTLQGSWCERVAPIISYLVRVTPLVALYTGEWTVAGRASSPLVGVLHYYALSGYAIHQIADTLIRALCGAIKHDPQVPNVPLPSRIETDRGGPTPIAQKTLDKTASAIDGVHGVQRALYYAATASQSIACGIGGAVVCSFSGLEGPGAYCQALCHHPIQELAIGFAIHVNGGVHCQMPNPAPPGVARRESQPYSATYNPGPSTPTTSSEDALATSRYGHQFAAYPPEVPIFGTSVVIPPQHVLYWEYTKFRLLIYPKRPRDQFSFVDAFFLPGRLNGISPRTSAHRTPSGVGPY